MSTTTMEPEALVLRLLQVDRSAPTPAYVQLKRNLEQAIRTGDIESDTALPAERLLADALGVSRMTVRRAVDLLVRDGVLHRRHGSGTYVRHAPLEQVVDSVQSFSMESRALGFKPGTRLLEVQDATQDPHVAAVLGLDEGQTTLSLLRLRTADDQPLAVQRAILAPQYASLSLDLLRNLDSLYATLEHQYGVKVRGARQTVTARLPTQRERRWLDLDACDPVLALERIGYDQYGNVAEYVQSAYHGGRYRMALDLGPGDASGGDGT